MQLQENYDACLDGKKLTHDFSSFVNNKVVLSCSNFCNSGVSISCKDLEKLIFLRELPLKHM